MCHLGRCNAENCCCAAPKMWQRCQMLLAAAAAFGEETTEKFALAPLPARGYNVLLLWPRHCMPVKHCNLAMLADARARCQMPATYGHLHYHPACGLWGDWRTYRRWFVLLYPTY